MGSPAAQIRAHREARGLTLRAAGDMLGFSHVYLTKVETGACRPSRRLLAAVREHLGPVDDVPPFPRDLAVWCEHNPAVLALLHRLRSGEVTIAQVERAVEEVERG